MKILVLIINYGSDNKEYCQKMVDTLCGITGYDFTIKAFSPGPTEIKNCREILIAGRFGFNFIEGLYDYLRAVKLDPWDYILFTENDNLFTQENFDTFFKYAKSDDYTIGFLRYSEENGLKYLIDLSNDFKIVEMLEGDTLARFDCCHQGCWFLPTKTVKKFLEKKPDPSEVLLIDGKYVESGENKMSNYYYSEKFPGSKEGIKKFIPLFDFENLLIHHQSNKHINRYCNSLLVTDLINERDKLRKV